MARSPIAVRVSIVALPKMRQQHDVLEYRAGPAPRLARTRTHRGQRPRSCRSRNACSERLLVHDITARGVDEVCRRLHQRERVPHSSGGAFPASPGQCSDTTSDGAADPRATPRAPRRPGPPCSASSICGSRGAYHSTCMPSAHARASRHGAADAAVADDAERLAARACGRACAWDATRPGAAAHVSFAFAQPAHVMRMSASARSAVSSVSTSGVLVTTTPAARAASRSM